MIYARLRLRLEHTHTHTYEQHASGSRLDGGVIAVTYLHTYRVTDWGPSDITDPEKKINYGIKIGEFWVA